MEKEPVKYIYETSVAKFVEEKVTEKRQENGQEIEVSKTVKTKKPIKIAVAKPERRKHKEAEIFYAKRLSFYLKDGLLPYSLVSKRYLNDGGPLSDDEKKIIKTLRERYSLIQNEYFEMPTPLSEENTKRRGEILLEMNEINRVLNEVQNSYSALFENTAEAKSKNDTIEWWILKLSLIDEDGTGYKPFYGEGTYEEQLARLEAIEDKDQEFTNEVIKKLSYFVSFWYSTGVQVTHEDFKSAEEHYEKNVSDYLFSSDENAKVEAKDSEIKAPEAKAPAPEPVAEVKPAEVAPPQTQ